MYGKFQNHLQSELKAIEDADLRVDLAAPNAEHKSMTGALDAFLEKMSKEES